jgi:hypothetical protein
MTDQEAQAEYDEALKLMEEIADSNNPATYLAAAARMIPNLMGLTHYLLQEVKRLKTEVEELKIPRWTPYGGS